MIAFQAKKTRDGKVLALLRSRKPEDSDDMTVEQWTVGGWRPAGPEWTGLGGATEYENIEIEDAIGILIEFGAEEINPLV